MPTVEALRAKPEPRPERIVQLDAHGARPGPPRLIVLHTTEGHDRPGLEDLDGLIRDFASRRPPNRASSTVANDREGNDVRMLRDEDAPWTQADFNPVALSIEQIAFARYPRAVWLSERMAQLENTALWIAHWSQKWEIPLVQSTVHGVCEHVNLGSRGGGHTDCGHGYPMDVVMELVADLVTDRIEPPSREDVWRASYAAVVRWRTTRDDSARLKDVAADLKALLRDRSKGTARQRRIWQDSLTAARRMAGVHGWGAELSDLETLLLRLLRRER